MKIRPAQVTKGKQTCLRSSKAILKMVLSMPATGTLRAKSGDELMSVN